MDSNENDDFCSLKNKRMLEDAHVFFNGSTENTPNKTPSKEELLVKLGITTYNPKTGEKYSPMELISFIEEAKQNGVLDDISSTDTSFRRKIAIDNCDDLRQILPSSLVYRHRPVDIIDVDQNEISLLLREDNADNIKFAKVSKDMQENIDSLSIIQEANLINMLSEKNLCVAIKDVNKYKKNDQIFFSFISEPFSTTLYRHLILLDENDSSDDESYKDILDSVVDLLNSLKKQGVTNGRFNAKNIAIQILPDNTLRAFCLNFGESGCSTIDETLTIYDGATLIQSLNDFQKFKSRVLDRFEIEFGIEFSKINLKDLDERFAETNSCSTRNAPDTINLDNDYSQKFFNDDLIGIQDNYEFENHKSPQMRETNTTRRIVNKSDIEGRASNRSRKSRSKQKDYSKYINRENNEDDNVSKYEFNEKKVFNMSNKEPVHTKNRNRNRTRSKPKEYSKYNYEDRQDKSYHRNKKSRSINNKSRISKLRSSRRSTRRKRNSRDRRKRSSNMDLRSSLIRKK